MYRLCRGLRWTPNYDQISAQNGTTGTNYSPDFQMSRSVIFVWPQTVFFSKAHKGRTARTVKPKLPRVFTVVYAPTRVSVDRRWPLIQHIFYWGSYLYRSTHTWPETTLSLQSRVVRFRRAGMVAPRDCCNDKQQKRQNKKTWNANTTKTSAVKIAPQTSVTKNDKKDEKKTYTQHKKKQDTNKDKENIPNKDNKTKPPFHLFWVRSLPPPPRPDIPLVYNMACCTYYTR